MISQNVSHYRILSRLGAGGMGEVYLAEDVKLFRKVAIKFLPQESQSDDRSNKRLIREARAAAKLDHPNICAIHEVGEEDGKTFIVMQYVEGETLSDRMCKKPLELAEALDIALQVADGLSEAHSQGIIHRDIKPQNIIINMRVQVKVLDFGLAMIQKEPEAEPHLDTAAVLTDPGRIMGSVPYLSPEQARGEPLDVRTDIFSFGIVLFEMLTGRHPFISDSVAATIAAILLREPPPPSEFNEAVPPALERVVSTALHKSREKRYQSVKQMIIDLKRLKQQSIIIDQQDKFTQTIPSDRTERARTINDEGDNDAPTIVSTRTTQVQTRRYLGSRILVGTSIIILAGIILATIIGVGYWSRMRQSTGVDQTATMERTLPAEIDYKGIMILIPAGEFIMGSNNGDPDEGPEHLVTLPDFYMDKFEVTNEQYEEFCIATGRRYPTDTSTNKEYFRNNPKSPVRGISWYDAKAYAEWAGKRLPSEQEWEKAASWDMNAQRKRKWPWGDDPDYTRANVREPTRQTKQRPFGPSVVGSYHRGASPYGLQDMAGNVAEWVEDPYQPYPGNNNTSQGYGTKYRIIRGGGYLTPLEQGRTTYRDYLPPSALERSRGDIETMTSIGFRCAISTDDPRLQEFLRLKGLKNLNR